jgi:hypothetical protein
MVLNKNDNDRNKIYCNEIHQPNFKIKTIPRVEIQNELIVIENIK